MSKKIRIYTDGGSRGNPGPAAAGFVCLDENNNQLMAKGIFLGEGTNNFAEYSAVIEALGSAKAIGADEVELFSDSELLVKQVNGQYKVKNENIKQLYAKVYEHLDSFKKWTVTHTRRENNTKADSLVNRSLDIKADVQDGAVVNRKSLRLGVLLSGGGRTLMNILEHIEDGKLNASVPVVISSRSTVKGVERAKAAGLQVVIIRRKDFASIEEFSDNIKEQLDAAKVDLVVQAGWLCLWNIPDNYENKVMNIHPALLPSFGGKGMWGHHVHEAVINAGCKVSGCTVHFCTNEYDKGPIIIQRGCAVVEGDDPDSLAERVFKQECLAYPQAIRLFAEERLSVVNSRVLIKQIQ